MSWLAPTGIWSTGKLEVAFVDDFIYKKRMKQQTRPCALGLLFPIYFKEALASGIAKKKKKARA